MAYRVSTPKLYTEAQPATIGTYPLTQPFGPLDLSKPPLSPLDSEWTLVTPVSNNFAQLPVDPSTSSRRALRPILSSLKAAPNTDTWPKRCCDQKPLRVRCKDLCDTWFAPPGLGGTVRGLEWYREDFDRMSHESILLQVTGESSVASQDEEMWWVRLERYARGDFVTFSPEKHRVVRPNTRLRAKMTFPHGVSFDYVVRVLEAIHQVSPHYFLIGANCWFFASMIVEMVDRTRSGVWVKGGGLVSTDHRITKGLNYHQCKGIKQRVP